MIKLGKLTDYAVVVMTQLACGHDGTMRSAHFLSEKTGLPEPTVAKVLKHLCRAALVESTRGAAGGYSLARPATEITVAEIIVAMDGPVAIVSCVEGSGESCKAQALCPVKGNWARVNDVIRRALESLTLADMQPAFPLPEMLPPAADAATLCGRV